MTEKSWRKEKRRELYMAMEREEEQEKKKPLVLDWSIITPTKENKPPPEVVVVAAQDEEKFQKEMDFLMNATDHQIKEKILRLRNQINSSLPLKLPDKGAKLRISLKLHEEELERRTQFQHVKVKEAECEKSTRSRRSCSPGARNGFNSEAPSSQTHPQSTFTMLFSQNLEDKPDLSSRISVNPKSKELVLVDRCNNQNAKSNGLSTNKGRREIKASSRRSPFCSNISSRDGNEHRSPTGVQNAFDSYSFYHPNQDKKSSSCLPKRRKAYQLQTSKQSRKRERYNATDVTKQCETVVLVDEEDCLLTETTQQDNVPVERTEAKIYYPSRDDPECVELHYSDIKCLDPEAFLSSTIMNFYIRYLQRPVSATGRSRSDYHFFSTYFYGKVKEAVSRKNNDKDTFFSKFRRWWKGVNIFEKAYILLPINENFHWSLVIICLPNIEDETGPIILHLDSLGYHNSNQIFVNVKRFLNEEWKYLNQTCVPTNLPIAGKIWEDLPNNIGQKIITVPQQKNDYDCGIFVLFFVERFIEEAPDRLRKKDFNMFGRKWFKPEDASCLRGRIKKLLEEEFEKPVNECNEPSSSSSSSGDDPAGCSEDLIDGLNS